MVLVSIKAANDDIDLARRLLRVLTTALENAGAACRVLERLIRDGEVETVKIGRRRLVPHAALLDYVGRIGV